ncbi:olfactory receptor 10A7-like [Ranitomeya variabilis]|uniref:olfactory receptor 10A7-like n=1 Tax=Ranitomeya variabilis TaxID=490064 RepID=UPI0040573508
METGNQTIVTEFILVGFSDNPQFHPNLYTPMYFFLANFSFLEISYLLTIVPKMLVNLLSQKKTISFFGCAVQFYCFLVLGSAECYMLAAMAYDRYNAICHPLLYNVIMRRAVCISLVIGCWIIGTTLAVIRTIFLYRLPFCGSNRINHFYCDILPLLDLVCSNSHFNEFATLIISSFLIVGSFLLTIISYTNIILTIVKHHPMASRRKAFSTCTSHLIVVTMFYGSGTIMYLRPKYGMDEGKFLSLTYTIIVPMLNPFIYTLRNNDVKSAVMKIVSK